MKSVFEKDEGYWNEKLDPDDSMSALPRIGAAKDRLDGDSNGYSTLRSALPAAISDRIRAMSGGSDMAAYLILLAGVNVLLQGYTRQSRVLVGMPALTEEAPQEFLVVKAEIRKSDTFRSLLGDLKKSVTEALGHQQLPFRKMVQAMNFEYTEDGRPNAQTVVSYSPLHTEERVQRILAHTYFDFIQSGAVLELRVRFDPDRYGSEPIARMIGHLVQQLTIVLFQPDLELSRADMLPESEKAELLAYNDTAGEYPLHLTLSELFELQALRTPDHVAVVYGSDSLTYRELNERTDRLACLLQSKGVQADDRVALLFERSVDMIVAMLGVLKAGGAYVPIDPHHPDDRIAYVLEDCGATVLLTQTRWRERTPFSGELHCIDEPEGTVVSGGSPDKPQKVAGPGNLAYLIYTSGTTGQPKGVMIEHRSVVNFTLSLYADLYEAHPEYRHMAQLAPYVFDMSVKPIYGALLFGRTLVIVPEALRADGAGLLSFFREHEVDITDGTPTYLSLLVQAGQGGGGELAVKHFVLGGEPLSAKLVRSVWSVFGEHVRVTNVYGPTECTVDSTIYDVETSGLPEDLETVPIGRPLPNQQIWILDDYRRLLPVGVAGEIHIGGHGVARGYNRRPELTAEKFIDNPYRPGTSMYRTGDLGRWLPGGMVEYMGRADHQVKIRGYRIELGDVEAQLLKLEAVQEAIVLARDTGNGDQRLYAYVAAVEPLTIGGLRRALSRELPPYMIPSSFVQVERMPLTPNGKVDRRALASLEANVGTGTAFMAPRNAREAELARIWQEVLGVPQVGVHDNFFELGGHSLSLMGMVQKASQAAGAEVSLQEVFRNPTIEGLAYALWEGKSAQEGTPFVPLNGSGPLNVLCFPPVSGFGIGYLELARQLEGVCRLYAVDFIDDAQSDEERLERYVEEALRVQAEGPLVLLGYSIGGNLMFEVAKALELRGCEVSDLIMLDSIPRWQASGSEDIEREAEEMLASGEGPEKDMLENPLIRERASRKVRAYLAYGAELVNRGTVGGHIHALIAEDTAAIGQAHELPTWRESAGRGYFEYTLSGEHEEVLQSPHVEANAAKLKEIMEGIAGRTHDPRKVLH
ncbi:MULTISPECIES: non-ribosomal peptide synthetase [Paenibacillus]|uniref:non-ribosomal peptide synthetase n=1 Tax=Paenibacillus TaxID=44249 RepID=UPI0022B93A71|nr:amino acid adenylation domain-containing protein [Paenibacillus caseinilyticus]MCZ8521905.1 amino acid adenylation domain-containing protein [Paenibacillus caseinilyticus]